MIGFLKHGVKPQSYVCRLYDCQAVPDPLRRSEVEPPHCPAHNRLTAHENHADDQKYHLEQITEKNVHFVVVAVSPLIHAGDFHDQIIYDECTAAQEERRNAPQCILAVKVVPPAALLVIFSARKISTFADEYDLVQK